MRRTIPSNPIYHDERAARAYLESLRWPDGPVCPRCGAVNEAAPMQGKSTRLGVWKCRKCRKPFTCTVGTVYERSKIPLRKWLLTMYLLDVSERGVSARQLHLKLGVSYKTASYMLRRIRRAARGHMTHMPLLRLPSESQRRTAASS